MKWCGINYNLSSRPTESGYCLRCLLANFRAALSLTLFNVVSDKFKWKCNEICLLSSVYLLWLLWSSPGWDKKWQMSASCWQCWPFCCQYSIQTKVSTMLVLASSALRWALHYRDTWHTWPLVTRTWSGSPSPPCPSSRSPPWSRSPQLPLWQVTS